MASSPPAPRRKRRPTWDSLSPQLFYGSDLRVLEEDKLMSPQGPQPARVRKRHPTPDSESGWASLPEDLIDAVASRLLASDLLHYVRFRAVCYAWRSGTADPVGRGVTDRRFHPRRWMMLPEGHYLFPGHPNLEGYVRFINLDTGTLVRSRIPFLGVGNFWPIDSVDGLLLLLRDTVDQEGAVRLLHPFTGDIAELPPIGTLASSLLTGCAPTLMNRTLTKYVRASVSLDAVPGAITVMLHLHMVNRIAFATSLDRQWSLSSWDFGGYVTESFQGKIYHVDTPSAGDQEKIHRVLQLDPPVAQDDGSLVLQQPKLIATIPVHLLVHPDSLVECGSDILVLGHNDWSRSQIVIFKLADLVLQRFIPVENIGGNTLFVRGSGISVSSRVLPTVKGDNVVYISSKPPYLAQYNLRTGSLSPAIDTCSLYGRASGPSSLVHYIFSCCDRELWGRGLIFRKEWTGWDPLLPNEEE